MPTTPNYAWITPTVGGDENTWGDELNQAFEDADADLKDVSDAQVADAAAITALDTRIDALEGFTPTGTANWRSSIYYRSPVCEGLNTELYPLTAGRRYLVPFFYRGVFNAFCFRHSGPLSNYTCEVLDTTSTGAPGSVLWTGATSSSAGPNLVEVVISPELTISRPAWLAISSSNGQIYVRGNSTPGSGQPRLPPTFWGLGSSVFNVTTYDEVVTAVYGNSAPYTNAAMGNFSSNMGPDIALRTA